ncbi:MAG: aldo/keto reductase [Desulfobacteraceae bacterium]|nr:aldo/keto reductase [Desulfobacteraceae bacterium]
MNFLVSNSNRLVLGTAQLGLNYGIANILGKPDQATANAIIAKAFENGIHKFDTAQGYGESETVLGRAIADHRLKNNAKIVSKLSLESDNINKIDLLNKIVRSIEKLQVERLYGLMLHKQEQLEMWDDGLGQLLSEFVNTRLIQHIGVSVYTPEKALQALNCENLDIIQIPSSILDNRFLDAGVFEKADRANKTLYIRSVFLQGLLLMDDLPEKMVFASDYHRKVALLAEELGISVAELALWYVREVFPEAKIVIGVDSSEQLQNNIDIWNDKSCKIDWASIIKEIGFVPQRVINPTLW